MRISADEHDLHLLLAWLSPSFPIGAFAWSHGLEYAVEEGLVRDCASLTDWVGWVAEHGAGRTDSDFLRESHQAVSAGDAEHFRIVVEEANAMRGTAEMALESSAQGQAFLRAIADSWPCAGLAEWRSRVDLPIAYPVAVGLAASLHHLPLGAVLTGYLHAMGANLISAGLRLVPLGQTDGQRALAALLPVFARAAQASLARDWADLGSAAPMVDWASMRHETQYTRLFRS